MSGNTWSGGRDGFVYTGLGTLSLTENARGFREMFCYYNVFDSCDANQPTNSFLLPSRTTLTPHRATLLTAMHNKTDHYTQEFMFKKTLFFHKEFNNTKLHFTRGKQQYWQEAKAELIVMHKIS